MYEDADLPKFALKDADLWQRCLDSNRDCGYGWGVQRFAARWASFMERDLGGGASLSECASKCSREADDEGITGFMYGCAVSELAAVWERGEELRRWHNLDTQLGHEGEAANEKGTVLNPALLSIG